MLEVTGLRKGYGRLRALDGFDLRVGPGEIAGLIGHNGAGKSTFVRAVAGLVRPDGGRVEVCGRDVAGAPAADRAAVGLAPQEPALYRTATVRENLRVFGGLAGLRRADLRRAIDTVAQAMHLTDVLDRGVGNLSGGQFRRTQTATALLHRPAVLLLDEPTVGADPLTREALLQAVRERAAEGAAVCYTTHYLPELDDLGATLAVAEAGRIIARGTRDELVGALPAEVLVHFDGPVPDDLAAGPGQRRVEDRTLRVHAHDPARVLAEVAAHAGAGLRSVDVRRPSLDDLYRALARREVTRAA